jgi:hypothetical protein
LFAAENSSESQKPKENCFDYRLAMALRLFLPLPQESNVALWRDPSIIETACDLPISGGWIVAMACQTH